MLRIVLVDDEPNVIKGMKHILSKNEELWEVIGTADNGNLGYKTIMELKPDVVITDIRMPDMDGIELAKQISEKSPETKIIMLSGHADFNFARKALRYGAYDYMLKPCRHKEITEVLMKITEEICHNKEEKKQKKKLEIELKSTKKEVEKRRFLEKLLGEVEEEEEIKFTPAIRLVVIEYNKKILKKEKMEQMLHRYGIDKIHMKEIPSLFFYNNRCIFLINTSINMTAYREKLYKMKCEMMKKGEYLYGAISETCQNMTELKKIYQDMDATIRFLGFNHIIEIIEEKEIQRYQEKLYEKELVEEKKILQAIFGGKVQQVEIMLNQSIRKIEKQNIYLDQNSCKMQLKHLMIRIENQLHSKKISLEMIFGREIDTMYEIERIGSKQQVFNWCKNVIIEITRYIEVNRSHLPASIQKAIDYIEAYYYEDIGMKEVADYVNLNPWYFSDLFKEKMGIVFSEYVTNLRIEKAKVLLVTSELKNYEIAEKVGFKNATYFSSVFKKQEKMTPKAYRNIQLK